MLRYYMDINNNFLFAHEKDFGFFVVYNSKTNTWSDSKISFLQFIHDYEPCEISEEIALNISNGNLPKDLFQSYLDMLKNIKG